MTLERARLELEKFVKLKTTQRPAFLDVVMEATKNPIRVIRCGECRYLEPQTDIHGVVHLFCAKRGWSVVKPEEYCSRAEEKTELDQTTLFARGTNNGQV